LKIIAAIEDPPVIVKILAHRGLPTRAPRDLEHFAPLRALRRPSQPKQHWDFHQTERRLTSHRSGDIARARKKGGLNFLYIGPRTPNHGRRGR
jgi:hypothetical protein